MRKESNGQMEVGTLVVPMIWENGMTMYIQNSDSITLKRFKLQPMELCNMPVKAGGLGGVEVG